MTSSIVDTAPEAVRNSSIQIDQKSVHSNLSEVREEAQTIELTPRQILKKNALPIAECFYIGFLMGINDGNFGIILPRIKEYYNISDSLVSILFIVQAVGYFVSAFLNGWLVQKMKALGVLYLGSFATVLAYVLLLIGLPFPAMCCFMAILGGSLALLDAGCNVYPSHLPYATTILNFVHAFYGFGALVGPLIASALLARGLSWKVSYMILCGLAVLNCICLWISFRKNPIPEHLEEDEEATQTESGEDDVNEKPVSPKRGLFAQAIRLKFTWIAALFLLFYVGVETTIGGWGYTFLTVARNGNAVTMGQVMSGYWAGLTVGRVILGHITGMFGEKRMITLYLFVTCGMIILIWQATSIGADAAGLVIAGFFLGPMFPTAIAITHQTLPKHLHATAIGFVAAFGQGGVAFFPFINGQIIDKAGIGAMMPYTLGLSAAATIVWVFLPTKTRSYDIIVNLWKKITKREEEPKAQIAEEKIDVSDRVEEDKATLS
ncbi:major facilitator superfamily domain-containing protein [Umbelopsis sp. PMI_123]|nr:major facilitator superfamily domain-containing protein [Umbelopsis sp. PMI_123]